MHISRSYTNYFFHYHISFRLYFLRYILDYFLNESTAIKIGMLDLSIGDVNKHEAI